MLAVFCEPLAQPSFPRWRTFRSKQVSHESLVFFPCKDNVSHDPTSHARANIRKGHWQTKKAHGAAHLNGNESHQLLEAEGFGSNSIEHSIPLLINGVSDQLRHVLHVDGTDTVVTVTWDTEHRKTTDEPGDVVDENVFEPEDDCGPQNSVREARVKNGL